MRHRSQPLSPSSRRTRQQASYQARLPSFWRVCLIVLSGATLLNVYTYKHRKIKFHNIHEGEEKSGAGSGAGPGNKNALKTPTGTSVGKSEKKNPIVVPAAFEEVDSAISGGGGGSGSGGGGVRGSVSGGNPAVGMGAGEGGDGRGYPGSAAAVGGGGRGGDGVRGGAGSISSAGVSVGSGAGGGASATAGDGGGVGGARVEDGRTSKPPQPSLPLGRDKPLKILARQGTRNEADRGDGGSATGTGGGGAGGGGGGGGGQAGLSSSIDELLWWPREDDGGGGYLPAAEVGHFPCSLTETDEFPTLAAGLQQQQQQQQKQTHKHNQSPVSPSAPCIVSCSLPPSDKEKELYRARGGSEEEREEKGGGGGDVYGPGDYPGQFEYCGRAIRACALYQECTHILLPPAPPPPPPQEGFPGQELALQSEWGGGKPAPQNYAAFATLLPAPKRDGSMVAVEAAASAWEGGGGKGGGGWGGTKLGFTLKERPRTYYVVSFGGSGSKMLGGWLSERGRGMVKEVFHIHDPKPADKLFVKESRKGVKPGRMGKGKDFRGYDFPEGDFPSSGKAVEDIDSYRVVLIFKDPAEALVSRYFYNHCKNLRGADCGGSEKAFPTLDRYAEERDDRLHMESFYDNYCDPHTVDGRRNYPVVCVNYHKLWDNKEALVKALGLPTGEALKLPTRTETIRNDQTSARRGEPFTLAVREQLRLKHASLSEKIFEAPAVAVV